MDGQRFYPLVVWSPPAVVLLFRSDAEEPQLSALSPAPGSPAATRPTSPCLACPCASDCTELRQQVGFWKSMFERCKQREERLRQELAELRAKNWQSLYEQSQERERVLQEQLGTLAAQVCVLEQRLRGRKSEKKKRHPETGPTSPSATPRHRGQQPTNPAPQRRTFDHLPTQEETCELPADAAC